MGMDCYAYTTIGFKVAREDFIEEGKASVETCSEGHPRREGSKGKFCEDDGTPFAFQTTEVATYALEFLATKTNEPLPDFKNEDEVADWWGDFAYGEFVLVLQENQGGEPEFMLAGVTVGGTDSHRYGGKMAVTTLADLQDAIAIVEQLRSDLGPTFSARPINVYTSLTISI